MYEDLSQLGFVVYFLSMAAVIALATLANRRIRPSLRKYPVKKICWGVLVLCFGYWYVMMPYVGRYYDFSTKLDRPENVESQADITKYLRNDHDRITRLEEEVKRTNDDLRQVFHHYQLLLQLGWYAILYFGCSQIAGRPKSEYSEQSTLDLEE